MGLGLIELIIVGFMMLVFLAAVAAFAFVLSKNRVFSKHKCRYCNAPISPNAAACPKCGEPA